MSYDLVVFEAEGVPREHSQFLEWYSSAQDTAEESATSLPEPASRRFADFYADMVKSFPDMNGPSGEGIDEDDHLAGYEFQPTHIYMDFRWSASDKACHQVMNLAQAHGLGLYDLNDVVLFPEDDPNTPVAPPPKSSTGTWLRNLFRP